MIRAGNIHKIKSSKYKSLKNMVRKSLNLEETCAICLDNLNEINDENKKKNCDKIVETVCNHKFHYNCIVNDNINNCPLCREELKFKNYCIININKN